MKDRRSAKTAAAYQRGAESFERFCQEKAITTLEDQKPGLLDDFVQFLIDQGLSPPTIRLKVAGTKSYLEWREREGEKVTHFFAPALPKIIPKEPFALDANQLVDFWRACASHGDPLRTILTLLPLCGLRTEEIVTIRMEEGVSVKNDWILLHVVGKGGKPRTVPLLPQGNPILGQYLHGWRVKNKINNPYLFPGHSRGRHYQSRTLRRHMAGLREEMGLDNKLTPHVLRKTYLTFLDLAGISPFAIAKLAGHSSPRTTHESYIHQSIDTLISRLGNVSVPEPETDDD